jgi:hypothetical protein
VVFYKEKPQIVLYDEKDLKVLDWERVGFTV